MGVGTVYVFISMTDAKIITIKNVAWNMNSTLKIE